MEDLSLEGVLRSELSTRLTSHIAGFLRDPVVSATPLLRVGVLGRVAHPGFYYAAADLPLSDVLMAAGGPAADADVSKLSIRRAGEIIIDQRKSRTALTEGSSLDMLNLQAGDEITVGSQRQLNWQVILPAITGVIGLFIAYSQLHDH
jgi:protein involved in polysaccharide export with SLBB domain